MDSGNTDTKDSFINKNLVFITGLGAISFISLYFLFMRKKQLSSRSNKKKKRKRNEVCSCSTCPSKCDTTSVKSERSKGSKKSNSARSGQNKVNRLKRQKQKSHNVLIQKDKKGSIKESNDKMYFINVKESNDNKILKSSSITTSNNTVLFKKNPRVNTEVTFNPGISTTSHILQKSYPEDLQSYQELHSKKISETSKFKFYESDRSFGSGRLNLHKIKSTLNKRISDCKNKEELFEVQNVNYFNIKSHKSKNKSSANKKKDSKTKNHKINNNIVFKEDYEKSVSNINNLNSNKNNNKVSSDILHSFKSKGLNDVLQRMIPINDQNKSPKSINKKRSNTLADVPFVPELDFNGIQKIKKLYVEPYSNSLNQSISDNVNANGIQTTSRFYCGNEGNKSNLKRIDKRENLKSLKSITTRQVYNNNNYSISILNYSKLDFLNKSWYDLELNYNKNSTNYHNVSLSIDKKFDMSNISADIDADDEKREKYLEGISEEDKRKKSESIYNVSNNNTSDDLDEKIISKSKSNISQINSNFNSKINSNKNTPKKVRKFVSSNQELIKLLRKKDQSDDEKEIEKELSNLKFQVSLNDKSEKKKKDDCKEYQLETIEVAIITNESKNTKQNKKILKGDHLITILDFIFETINPDLIDISEYYTVERRKFFKVFTKPEDTNSKQDKNSYFKAINIFLKKKEEFFLCVLYEVMVKFNISKTILDNSLLYYMTLANEEDEYVMLIKSKYNEVYNAGVKW